MRVITGTAKGVRLKSPSPGITRATSDLTRGAVFSALESMGIEWGEVLDLYAGSGALGIEALSRGAEKAYFVDRNRAACEVIRQNLAATGFTERGVVIQSTVEDALSKLPGVFSVILMDPPYEEVDLDELMNRAAESKASENCKVMVLEHSRRKEPAQRYGRFVSTRRQSHGETQVTFYVGAAR